LRPNCSKEHLITKLTPILLSLIPIILLIKNQKIFSIAIAWLFAVDCCGEVLSTVQRRE